MNWKHLTILLILLKNSTTFNTVNYELQPKCTQVVENVCRNGEDVTNVQERYKEDMNLILQDINAAKKKSIPCTAILSDPSCECHKDMIYKDLAPFQEKGITKNMIKEAANYGTRYKIYEHKLFRDSNCMFPSRCEGIEHFILKLLPNLPNIDLVINTRDYPQVHSQFGHQIRVRPVFSFSKTSDYLDIMYPAWTFWAGGPAISLYPTGIGRWDLHREKISNAARKYPWSSKKSKGFFRGSRTSDERDSLILISRKKPHLIDAQYTKNQAWKSAKDTLNAEPASEVSFEEHCHYKYLFNFRGVAASFRLKHLFLCKSLVFHVGNEWLEFFYPSMQPWIHYVPIKKYPTEKDIEDIIKFFQEHDDLAYEIATNGYEFIWNHLRMQDIECFWKKLLKSYAKLLKFKIEEDSSMIEIKPKLNRHT